MSLAIELQIDYFFSLFFFTDHVDRGVSGLGVWELKYGRFFGLSVLQQSSLYHTVLIPYSGGFHGVTFFIYLFFCCGSVEDGMGWCGEHRYRTVRVSRRTDVRLGAPGLVFQDPGTLHWPLMRP